MFEVYRIYRMTEKYEIAIIRLIMMRINIKAVSFDLVLKLAKLYHQLKSHQTIIFLIWKKLLNAK